MGTSVMLVTACPSAIRGLHVAGILEYAALPSSRLPVAEEQSLQAMALQAWSLAVHLLQDEDVEVHHPTSIVAADAGFKLCFRFSTG